MAMAISIYGDMIVTIKVTLWTMATLRRVSWEAGSALGVSAMWCKTTMAGLLPTINSIGTLGSMDIAQAFSRHHLEVRDRSSEFSGPWQLLDQLPDSTQLQLTLNFSVAARWVSNKPTEYVMGTI